MSDINELEICIKAVKENSNLSFIASMTFNKISGNVFKTIMGVSIKDMVERVYSFSGRIVGTNCGNGSREMLEIVKAMKDETKKYSKNIFLIAQPNAGMPVVENQITKYNETPYDFKEIIPFYLEAGINIIGGCCGTTPEHIKVIRKLIDSV
jgi:5-methyltetrahydrofolate--homocysteine methyltransferase